MSHDSLLATFRQWKGAQFTPNLRSGDGKPGAMVGINAFLATMVKNGGDPSQYSPKEWTEVVRDEGVTDEDDIAAALENIGTWTGHLGL
jgi:hypothetical protein